MLRPKNVTWSEERTRKRAKEAAIKKKCKRGGRGGNSLSRQIALLKKETEVVEKGQKDRKTSTKKDMARDSADTLFSTICSLTP